MNTQPPKAFPDEIPESTPITQSHAKRLQILQGAGVVFLKHGYEGASMSHIAQEAGVSKGALYNHFENKADLFIAFFEKMSYEKLSTLEKLFQDDTLNINLALFEMAQTAIQLMLNHNSVGLYRIILLEAQRFPQLVETFWQCRFNRLLSQLSSWLQRKTREGVLVVDDCDLASEQFLVMCQTRIVQRCRLSLPVDSSPAQIKHIANLTAKSFLRIYQNQT